jgi:hypothetical protein
VFAAIERHRQAVDTRAENADQARKQEQEEDAAMIAWVKMIATALRKIMAEKSLQ